MKNLFLFLLSTLISSAAFAQPVGWTWANTQSAGRVYMQYSGWSTSGGSFTGVDSSGNVYVTGTYGGIGNPGANFGASANLSGYGFFLARYAQGTLSWAKAIRGFGTKGQDIAIDKDRTVVVVGNTQADTLTIANQFLNNPTNDYTGFVARYDTTGHLIWGAFLAPCMTAIAVAIDDSGNVYVAGEYYASATPSAPPSPTIGGTTLPVAIGRDLFVVKYNSSGGFQWVTTASGSGNTNLELMKDIKVDTSGAIIIAGDFSSSTINFGSIVLNNPISTSIFIAKLNSSGSFTWATSANYSGVSGTILRVYSMAVDLSGNIYLSGTWLNGTISFGNGVTLSTPNTAGFLVKYNSQGVAQWALKPSNNFSYVTSVTVDNNGRVCVAGTFTSDTLNVGNKYFPRFGISDAFVATYNSSGTFQSAFAMPGIASGSIGNVLSCHVKYQGGKLYAAGNFATAITLGSYVLTSAESTKVYVAAYSLCPPVNATVTRAGSLLSATPGQGSYQWFRNNLAIPGATSSTYNVTQNGNYHVVISNGTTCSYTSDMVNMMDLAVKGITTELLDIYPQPCNEQFTILTGANLQDAKLQITDIQGKSVDFETRVTGNGLNVRLLNVRTGVYILRLTSGGRIYSGKIATKVD